MTVSRSTSTPMKEVTCITTFWAVRRNSNAMACREQLQVLRTWTQPCDWFCCYSWLENLWRHLKKWKLLVKCTGVFFGVGYFGDNVFCPRQPFQKPGVPARPNPARPLAPPPVSTGGAALRLRAGARGAARSGTRGAARSGSAGARPPTRRGIRPPCPAASRRVPVQPRAVSALGQGRAEPGRIWSVCLFVRPGRECGRHPGQCSAGTGAAGGAGRDGTGSPGGAGQGGFSALGRSGPGPSRRCPGWGRCVSPRRVSPAARLTVSVSAPPRPCPSPWRRSWRRAGRRTSPRWTCATAASPACWTCPACVGTGGGGRTQRGNFLICPGRAGPALGVGLRDTPARPGRRVRDSPVRGCLGARGLGERSGAERNAPHQAAGAVRVCVSRGQRSLSRCWYSGTWLMGRLPLFSVQLLKQKHQPSSISTGFERDRVTSARNYGRLACEGEGSNTGSQIQQHPALDITRLHMLAEPWQGAAVGMVHLLLLNSQ